MRRFRPSICTAVSLDINTGYALTTQGRELHGDLELKKLRAAVLYVVVDVGPGMSHIRVAATRAFMSSAFSWLVRPRMPWATMHLDVVGGPSVPWELDVALIARSC